MFVRRALLSALVLIPHPAAAGAVRYIGHALDAQGRPLYQEEHFLEPTAGGGEQRLVIYRCPDGQPFARKHLRRAAGTFLPTFDLEDRRSDYREGVAAAGNGVRVFAGTSAAEPDSGVELEPQSTWVADAGFDAFIQARRAELEQGRTLRFEFLVPAEGRTRPLTVRKVREGQMLGRPASLYRLELGAWYGFLAPHIDGWYDRDSGRLLRYQGISNIRDAGGRSLEARIDFPPDQRSAGIDATLLAAAGNDPLVAQCTAPPPN